MLWKVALNTIKQTNNILYLLTFAIAIFVIKKVLMNIMVQSNLWEKEKIAL